MFEKILTLILWLSIDVMASRPEAERLFQMSKVSEGDRDWIRKDRTTDEERQTFSRSALENPQDQNRVWSNEGHLRASEGYREIMWNSQPSEDLNFDRTEEASPNPRYTRSPPIPGRQGTLWHDRNGYVESRDDDSYIGHQGQRYSRVSRRPQGPSIDEGPPLYDSNGRQRQVQSNAMQPRTNFAGPTEKVDHSPMLPPNFDVSPNNWVRPNYPVEPLPRNVVVHLDFIKTNYFGTMTIGIPKQGLPEQTLRVNFDTGSTILWVVSKDACDNGFCNPGQRWYDRRMSSSYTPMERRMKTTFVAQAAVHGVEAEEIFILGEGKNKLLIKNQHFGEAMEFQIAFPDYDVIFGCSFEHPSTLYADGEPDPALLQMTKQFGTAPVFGVYYNKYYPKMSRITFGVEEDITNMVAGPFNTHNVVKVKTKNHGIAYRGWNLFIEGWLVEGLNTRPLIFPVPDGFFVVVDSGATHIGGPKIIIQAINKAIFSFARFRFDEDFTFDCSVDVVEVWTTFPNVSVMIDGFKYTFEPQDYIGQIGGMCTTYFRELNIDNYVILGHQFLQKYYTRFDHGNKQLHMALLRRGPHPVKFLRNALRLLGQE